MCAITMLVNVLEFTTLLAGFGGVEWVIIIAIVIAQFFGEENSRVSYIIRKGFR
jgi:hypothetical protein